MISLSSREIYDNLDSIISEASACANSALQGKNPDTKTIKWVMDMLIISKKKAKETEDAMRPKKEVLEVFTEMTAWLGLGIAARAILK